MLPGGVPLGDDLLAHNPKVAGSNQASATGKNLDWCQQLTAGGPITVTYT